MNLRFGFIEEPLKFKQLWYEHLVVGEIATIRQCCDQDECEARLILLDRISYWTLRGAAWSQIRAFYADVLSGVETGSVDWRGDFAQWLAESESMLIDRPAISQVVKPDKQRDMKRSGVAGGKKLEQKEARLWFCSDFNAIIGCVHTAPHTVTDAMGREHEAHHICARCYCQRNQKKEHAQVSEVCPLKA